jgi:hypothetical protein
MPNRESVRLHKTAYFQKQEDKNGGRGNGLRLSDEWRIWFTRLNEQY